MILPEWNEIWRQLCSGFIEEFINFKTVFLKKEGNILDFFANSCLKFGHVTLILPIIVIGMIFHRRDLYSKAACFLFWVMICNTLLKLLFKVPLFQHLGPGYAFPSGHMHAASVFYGYMIYKIDNKFATVLLTLLLGAMGFSLVYCHFHDWIDVLGAVGFSIAEILLYHILSYHFGDKIVGIIAIVSSIFVIAVLNVISKIEPHVWLAFYAMVGMEFSLLLIKETKLKTIWEKLIALLLSVFGIAAVYVLFKYLSFEMPYLSEVRFMFLPLIIMSSIIIVANFKKINFI